MKTILYDPKSGFFYAYDPRLHAQFPNLVAMTKEEWTAMHRKLHAEMPRADAGTVKSAPPEVVSLEDVAAVPDEEIIEFGRKIGVDCSDLLEMAGGNEAEVAEARKAARKQIERKVRGLARARAREHRQEA